MRKLLILFFISPLFFACTSDNIPPGVLSVNQLKGVVWDLMKANEIALNDTIHHKEINLTADETMLFQKVFLLHNIDKNSFYTSYDFYIQHPEWNSILLDSVNAVASRERNNLYTQPHPKLSKKDSAVIKNFPLRSKKADSTFFRRLQRHAKSDTNFVNHLHRPVI